MEETLAIQLMDKKENVINANGQDQERNDFCNDQSDLDAEEREHANGRRNGEDNEDDSK